MEESATSQVAIPQDITALLESQELAVLSTHRLGQPHASLVAFAASADGRKLFFATTRTSRKFINLRTDPRAVLLIDSRTHQAADFHQAQAISATGIALELFGPEKDAQLPIFLNKHPHLREFVQSPSCALMELQVEVYSLVSKFQKVIEYRLSS